MHFDSTEKNEGCSQKCMFLNKWSLYFTVVVLFDQGKTAILQQNIRYGNNIADFIIID